jgi:predicted nucleotidyltransferase component of viral defense system
MLFYETINATTLELLKKLQSNKVFENLLLVGGTSLALQIGHRVSIDIDLFGKIDINTIELNKLLSSYGEMVKIQQTNNIHIFTLNGVKTDIVNYSYPWIRQHVSSEGLKLASKEDIAAMKLSAITGRGTKKDFVDLYFLLKHFTLSEMLSFYEEKYADGSVFMVLRSLSYFDDAEEDPMPRMLHKTDWGNVKTKIMGEIKKIN